MGQLLDFYISTHAPLAGRDSHLAPVSLERKISTHAPLAGRDYLWREPQAEQVNFNPRAPCGARLVCRRVSCWHRSVFQPTRPLRGATTAAHRRGRRDRHFNPRAPCGARRFSTRLTSCSQNFNPRAPCGARRPHRYPKRTRSPFQPTRPLRGATDG